MKPELSQDELLRYSRHLVIPEVGLEGQKKLKSASVLIVGTGGLGSPISLYLAAAGVGTIGLVDYDLVDESNLQRQVLFSTESLLKVKVDAAAERLRKLNPFIEIQTFNEIFSTVNARKIAKDFDILVDGTDNFPTRYLLNDLAVLTRKPYIYGSVFRFEGQVSVFDSRIGPCYRCMFPEPPRADLVPSCADGGVFGVIPGMVGLLEATETLKIILGIGHTLVGKLMLVDALDMHFQTVRLSKNPDCIICGKNPAIKELINYEEFCGVTVVNHGNEMSVMENTITPAQLKQLMDEKKPIQIVDVRAPVELQVSAIPGSELVPFEKLYGKLSQWDKDSEIIFYCRTGSRSARAVRQFIEAGFRNVRSLKGGINAWANEIDPSLLRY
jgi:molybdopterin/thiamine biosynthesis adenylyltransferase/rhodanese-related sulfurtransferase